MITMMVIYMMDEMNLFVSSAKFSAPSTAVINCERTSFIKNIEVNKLKNYDLIGLTNKKSDCHEAIGFVLGKTCKICKRCST
jgi:hypothetical protein